MRLWVFLLWFFAAPGAFAFQLSPLVLSFSPAGERVQQTLILENPSREKIALQLEAFERKQADGQETRIATSSFEIVPSQLALKPREKRSVRVTWKGAEHPATELPFRIVATQLPVGFKGAPPKILLEYVASVYVAPEDSKPNVKVASVNVGEDGVATVSLVNEGTRHATLHQGRVIVASEGNPALANDELTSLTLLPGEKRELKIPNSGLKTGDYQARLSSRESE